MSRPARSAFSWDGSSQTGWTDCSTTKRPDAKRPITDEQVEQVIIRTPETTPPGATHWSTREMRKPST
jgi:hypothetical protein